MTRALAILVCLVGGCARTPAPASRMRVPWYYHLRPSSLNLAITAPDAIEHTRGVGRGTIIGISAGISIPLWPVPTAPQGPFFAPRAISPSEPSGSPPP